MAHGFYKNNLVHILKVVKMNFDSEVVAFVLSHYGNTPLQYTAIDTAEITEHVYMENYDLIQRLI